MLHEVISKDEVKHIAKLARLELTEEEVKKMQKDLSTILDYFKVLKKAPQKSAEKRACLPAGREKRGNKKNELRKDEAKKKPASLANNLIAQAPDKYDGHIRVKAVL